MASTSEISNGDNNKTLYVMKLEHELQKALQEYKFTEALWAEKEESFTSIISEQRKVISLLESVLKNNQHLLDAMQEGIEKKEGELHDFSRSIEESFQRTDLQVKQLKLNLKKTEETLDRKERELQSKNAKISDLVVRIEGLQQDLEKAKQQFQQVNVGIRHAEDRLHQKERELNDSNGRAVQAEKVVNALREEISSRDNAWLEKNKTLISQHADLKKQMHELSNSLVQVKRVNNELQKDIVDLKSFYEKKNNEQEKNSGRIQHSLTKEIRALNALLDKATNDNKKLTLALSEERKQYAFLNSSYKNKIIEQNSQVEKLKQALSESATLRSALENVRKEFGELEEKYQKNHVNTTGLFAREVRYKKTIEELQSKVVAEKERAYEMISYKLGFAIIQAGKSFDGLARLPGALLRIRKEAKQRKLAKSLTTKVHSRKTSKSTTAQNAKISLLDHSQIQLSEAAQSGRLKVAGVMDEFTFHSYAPEADILQLTPDLWEAQLQEFQPNILFIESAWQGLDGLWKTKISNAKEEIRGAIDWCRKNKVPTLFWNKEDPVHFGTFLPLASLVDYVFTTDIDCIPRYKYRLGHDNVYLLPFAAQPKTHNPIEKFERKDAFNFAGSYYLRYPERQRDFASLIDTVEQFRGVEIYDRNFDNPHPHYTFPEKYKRFILGKLPFSEIDKAYKGYRYGINMNTIKQSQTMFARRVFELLASNTVVISNFSRGVRLLFGDLIVSSDNASQLKTQLDRVCSDEINYRKLRLLGLRKVFKEHTYAHRLSYIKAKLLGQTYESTSSSVYVIANVNNISELDAVQRAFDRQKYAKKTLLILSSDDSVIHTDHGQYLRTVIGSKNDLVAFMNKLDSATWISIFSVNDYYGPNYLTDLQLATSYSNAYVVGKSAFYLSKDNLIKLNTDGGQYKFTERLLARSSLFNRTVLTDELLEDLFSRPDDASLNRKSMLAIDEFNYCYEGANLDINLLQTTVDDIYLPDQGVSYTEQLIAVSENLRAISDEIVETKSTSAPFVSGKDLFSYFVKPASTAIQFALQNDGFKISSKLPEDKHAYIYTKNRFKRDELNLVLNSEFKLHCDGTLAVMTVFEFQDASGAKISHSMNKAGDSHALAIPENCVYVRIGLKIQASGYVSIEKLVFGNKRERPFAIIGKSNNLVISKQYPDYGDLYKYGFVHSRLRKYKDANTKTDVFRVTNDDVNYYREFEGIDVASGDYALLDQSLSTGQFSTILIHILDEKIWEVIRPYLKSIRVIVWVHGSEIQHWKRRSFEFKNMSEAEIKRQKRLSDKRMTFWKEVFSVKERNLHFVFVSKWLVESTEADFGIEIPKISYSVINNFIDDGIFKYVPKIENDRLKLLSIRPYAKLVYGNDLTVRAILELSKRPFFSELSFTLIGDGDLFEETVFPLRQFSNVNIEKRFLTHAEIAEYHRKNGIFLVPTRMDTQGVSRDEAMSSGLVPITTDVAAIPEFVNRDVGIVVPAENYNELADAVEYLYRHPEEYLSLSRNAAERTKARFGFEATLKNEISLIEMRET